MPLSYSGRFLHHRFLFILPVILLGCQTDPLAISDLSIDKVDGLKSAVFEGVIPLLQGKQAGVFNEIILTRYQIQQDSFTAFISGFDPVGDRIMTTEYKVGANDGQLLSLLLHHTWAVPGTSVLLHHYQSLLFDRKKGRELMPEALFSDPPGLLKKLNQQVETKHPECGPVSKEQIDQFVITPEGEFTWYFWLYAGDPACLDPVIISLAGEEVAFMK